MAFIYYLAKEAKTAKQLQSLHLVAPVQTWLIVPQASRGGLQLILQKGSVWTP